MSDEGNPHSRMPTPQDVAISQILEDLAEGVSDVLRDVAGERYGMALFVFPFNKLGHGSYVSNCERADVIKTVREILERLEKNQPTPAVHTLTEQN